MALAIAKGVLTSPTGTPPVSQTISITTGTNWPSGTTPQAVIVWGAYSTAAGQTNGPGRMMMGFATNDGGSVQQAAVAGEDQDGAATSVCTISVNTTDLIHYCKATTTVDASATLTSFGSDQFVLNWVTLPTTASQKIHYMVLGGSDLTAARVGTFTQITSAGAPTTPRDITVASGWGQPECIIAINGSRTALTDANASSVRFHVGAGRSDTEMYCSAVGMTNGSTTETAFSGSASVLTFESIALNPLVSTTLTARSGWPVDGFQLVQSAAATAAQICPYLALKGTFQSTAGKVLSSATLNGTVDFAAGFAPVGALTFGANNITETAAGGAPISADQTSTQLGGFGVGGWDGTNEGYAGFAADDANATMNTGQSHSETKSYQVIEPSATLTAAPVLNGEAGLSASGNNVRFTWTDAANLATYINGVLAFGSAAGAAPSALPFLVMPPRIGA